MSKGIKVCPSCKTENGARAGRCKSCEHKFEIKVKAPPKPKKEKKPTAKLELKKGETRRGVKICPDCQTAAGGRVLVCKECGRKFVKEDTKKAKAALESNSSVGKGKKTCPGCNEIIASSLKECKSCGHKFLSKKVVKKLKEPEVLEPEVLEPEVLEPEVLEPEVLEEEVDPGTILEQVENMGVEELEVLDKNLTIPKSVMKEDIVTSEESEEITELIEEERKIEALIRERLMPNLPEKCPHCEEVIEIEEVVLEEKYTALAQALRIVSYGDIRANKMYEYAQKHECWDHVDWEEVVEQLGMEI